MKKKTQRRKGRLFGGILSGILTASMLCGSLELTAFAAVEPTGAETGIPAAETEEIPTAAGTVYYVDSNAAEGGDGTVEQPFQTLAEVNAVELQPGDGISLKAGSIFDDQQLVPKGTGTQERPIVINTYGEGSRPVINAGGFRKTGNTNEDGTPEYAGHKEAVLIENMEHVYVTGLEMTNDDDFAVNWVTDNGLGTKDKDYPRRLGVHVTIDERARNNSYKTADDGAEYRSYKGIVIDNCYIHDVDGNENRGVNKVDGGIGIEVIFSSNAGVYPYFDGVVIQNNRLNKCDRTGIKGIRISDLDNFMYHNPEAADYDPNCDRDKNGENDQSRYNNIRNYDQVQKNYRVVGNYLSDIGGDGILICETKGAVVEHNVLDGQAMRAAGANAGIWSWNAFDTLFRYNESFHGPAYNQDGCSFDSDYWSAGTIFEYNYSHDTPMGFMLLMGSNDTDIVRYNVSQNDGKVWRHVAGNSNTPSYIYNNVFYYDGDNWEYNYTQAMNGKSNWRLYNNIFYNTSTTTPSNWGGSNADWSKVTAATNMVYEASGQYGEGEIPNAIHADPKFVNPGAGATASDGISDWESLRCYELQADSPAINAGTYVNVVPQTTSGNAGMWDDTSNRNAAHDFFGNPLYNGVADLGIAESAAVSGRDFPVEANASYLIFNYQTGTSLKSDESGVLSMEAAGSEFILASAGEGYHIKIWNTEKNAYLYLNGSESGVELSETLETVWTAKDVHNGQHYLEAGGKALTWSDNALSMQEESAATQWQLLCQENSKFFNAGGELIDGFSADQDFDEEKNQSGYYGKVQPASGLTGEGVYASGLTGEEVGYKIYAKEGEHSVKLYLSGRNTAMDILVNGEIYQTGHTLSADTEILELVSIYPAGGLIDVKLLAAYNEDGEKTGPILNGISAEKMPMSEVKMTINCGNTAADGSGNHDGLGGDTAFDGGSGYYVNGETETAILNEGLSGAKPVPDAGMGTALKCARTGTDFGYKFKAKPGNYRIKLYFNMPSAEETEGTFDITINGETVESGFDIKAAAGGNDKAVDITKTAASKNGLLDIGFKAVTGTASVNAIVVEAYNDVSGENLAAGSTVTASGYEADSMKPEYAVDDSQSTRWASGATSNETWICTDLKKDYMVDTLVIDWTPGAYAVNYRIEVKAGEGEDWTTVKKVTSAFAGINVLSIEPVQARWVKVVGESYNDQWGMSMTELGIFGEEMRGKAAALAATEKTGSGYVVKLGLENIYNTYRTLTFAVNYDPKMVEPVAGSEKYLAETALRATRQSSADNEDGTRTLKFSFDFKKQGTFKEAADVMSLTFKALSTMRSTVYVNTTFTTADGHETKLGKVKSYVPNDFTYEGLKELIRQTEQVLADTETGFKPGQYTQEVKDALGSVIAEAKKLSDSASQAELEAAYKALDTAVDTFYAAVNQEKYHTYHADYAVDQTADYTYNAASGTVAQGVHSITLNANGAAIDNKAPRLKEGNFYVRFRLDNVEDQTLFTVGNGIKFGYDKGGGNWFYDSASNGAGWGNFATSREYALTAEKEHTIEFQFKLNESSLYDLTLYYDGTKLGTCTNVGYDTAGGSYGFMARRAAHNMQVKEVYYTAAPKHTLTVSAGEHGLASWTGELTTYEEAYKTVFFTPDPGYKVDKILVDGVEVKGKDNSYTFEYILADQTLAVTFKQTDKTELETAIAKALHLIEKDYTPESWAELKGALENAQAVQKDAGAAQNQIDIAASLLNVAIAKLKPMPIVTKVTVTPGTIRVEQGNTQKFTAAVSGKNNPDTGVSWNVEGAKSRNTKISAAGVLSVGIDETAAALTVTAVSVATPGVSGKAAVTVTRKAVPTVTKVVVSPSTANVVQRGSKTFKAAVSGTNNPSRAVTWSVSGAKSRNTKISSAGKLTVGKDETASSLSVKATSKVAAKVYGTAKVKVLVSMGNVKNSSVKAYTYTGKTIKPSVKLTYNKKTLKKNTDYTVSYKNNKNVGKATITVKGKGKYSGTKTITFKINPKSTSLSSVSSKKSRILTVKWKKNTAVTGYQITYSTSSKFTKSTTKTLTVKKNKTVSSTIKKLKGNKKYYVKIRTYKKVGKTTYYSTWSKAKSVKIKR